MSFINRSDRFAILSTNALDILTQYWFDAGRPMGFLFLNRNDPDKPMASFTVNQFISAKEAELGWEHRLTCHSFRHYVECFKMVSDSKSI